MRTDFIDYPTAWEIQKDVGEQLDHDPLCSSVPGEGISGPAFLCDCQAMPLEWARRVSELEPERTAEVYEFVKEYLPQRFRDMDVSELIDGVDDER